MWDGLGSHRSRPMPAFLGSQRGWLVAERLPGYAPELNPVEGVWANLKGQESPTTPPTASTTWPSTPGHRAASGATGSFSLGSVAVPGSSTLTVRTTAKAPRGTYTPTVSGASGSKTHQATTTLTIR